MVRALYLTLAVLVSQPEPASANAPPDVGANAALKYWQAFATLPKFTHAEESKLFAEYLTMPLDNRSREIVTKAAYSLRMMHQGAAQPNCNWGLAYEEGVGMLLPHGPAARTLAVIACLRARMRFEEGHSAEAIDDLIAAATLGRHITRDGINILVLVGYSIENFVGETLALYMSKLDAATLGNLKARLAALPPGGTPATAMKFEEATALDWFVHEVKAAKDKDSLVAFLTQVHGLTLPERGGRVPKEKGREFLEACGGTVEGIVNQTDQTRGAYVRLGKKLDLPVEQFEKEWNDEKTKHAANPVFKLFVPALEKMRRQAARADIRRALLSAAIDVQQNGRDSLKDHPDPVVGGPFEYRALDQGFELSSKWLYNGQTIRLVVGSGKKD
jgi:hypothetical protein